jgi:hypothetical protein
MRDWKLPGVLAFSVVVAAIVTTFGLTDDPEMRKQLIGYLSTMITFVIGAATGGAVGGTVGFAKGTAAPAPAQMELLKAVEEQAKAIRQLTRALD